MARQQTFTKADVTRAVSGALAAGAKVARLELDREGKIVIVFGEGEPTSEETPLQRWQRENGQG